MQCQRGIHFPFLRLWLSPEAEQCQPYGVFSPKAQARKAAKACAQHAQSNFRYLEGQPLLFRIIWRKIHFLCLFEKSLCYEYYLVWKNQPNTNIIRSEKSPKYEYEYYSVWKIHPNTNTNIIRFEKITRIRIRILFGLKKSPEYE